MARRARILTWNGKDVPAELRDLPAGRYVVEAVDEEARLIGITPDASFLNACYRTLSQAEPRSNFLAVNRFNRRGTRFLGPEPSAPPD